MSDLDRTTATLALGDGDQICEWYRRPVIGGDAYPRLQAGRGVLESGLCGECASLTQAMLGARPDTSLSHNGQGDVVGVSVTRIILDEGYTFQKPYRQLRDDADFCALCQTIEDSVVFTQRYAAGHDPAQIPPGNHLYLEPVKSDNDMVGFLVRVVEDENTSETDSETSSSDAFEGGFKSNPTWKGFLEVEVWETEAVRTFDNSSSFDAIKGREAVNTPGSSFGKAVPWRDMTQMLHSWLRDCDSVHGVCRDHKNSRRSSTDVDTSASPTRLLEIQQVNGRFLVRLVAGTGNRTRYTALGHRWGDYRSSRTTTTNIEQYRNGIKFDSLPLTLRQAVQITHAAGVRHLWVDCLCIIQNDDNDWAQEAPKMGSIYASAYFTIAASAFEDAGCFPLKFSEDHRVTIDVHPGFELKISPRSSDFNTWAIEHEPLQKRGWTLQERLLSQRILYCSRYEYYWLCREQRLRAYGDPGDWFVYGSVMPPIEQHGLPLLLSYSPQSREAALTEWYMLLLDYSNRQLTLEKDKLIAINGLVDIFQRWIGSRYLHGLWECDLACGLVWYPGSHWSNNFSDSSDSEREIKTFAPDKSRFRRTYPTRAPSWSWASADGFQEHFGSQLNRLADASGKPLSELVYVKATIASDDEHRSFLGGELSAEPQILKISGRLSKAFYGYEDAEEQNNRVWQLDREGGSKVFSFIADDPNFDPDEHIADAESSRLLVLPISAHMGLVITPASEDNVPLYRRVGTSNFMIPYLSQLDGDKSEGSTARTFGDGSEYATVQTNDGIIEALGSVNKTDIKALDEDTDAALYTEGESSGKEDSINTEDIEKYGGFNDWYCGKFLDECQWLGKTGVSETIFLC